MIFIFFVLCLKILLCVELREAGFLTNALRYPCSLYFIQNWFFFHFSWLHWQISYKPGQLGFISLNTGNTALEQIFKRVTISDNFWFTGWKCWRCRSPKPRTWPLLTLRWMCVWVPSPGGYTVYDRSDVNYYAAELGKPCFYVRRCQPMAFSYIVFIWFQLLETFIL